MRSVLLQTGTRRLLGSSTQPVSRKWGSVGKMQTGNARASISHAAYVIATMPDWNEQRPTTQISASALMRSSIRQRSLGRNTRLIKRSGRDAFQEVLA